MNKLPPENALAAVSSYYDEATGTKAVWTALAGGGSSRRFFRVTGCGEPFVLVAYQLPPLENRLYGPLAKALGEHNLPVPALYWEDAARHCLAVEDLGSVDLYATRDRGAGERRLLYERALQVVTRWHQLPADFARRADVETLPPFDLSLYQFEHAYFAEHCLGRLFPSRRSGWDAPAVQADLARLTTRMLAAPVTWIHRDLQSRNLMLRGPEEAPVLIDFQGMRRGNPAYDLASLLFDPYADLSPELHDACLAEYVATRGENLTHWQEEMAWAGVQRLLQALGAYGKLAILEGKEEYLPFVPIALRRLRDLSDALGLKGLARLLHGL